MRSANRILPISLLLSVALATGCTRYTEFRSVSPSGHELVIEKDSSGAASYAFDVLVFAGESKHLIYKKLTDSSIGLVEVHWPTDRKSVGILICDMLSGPIFISYDISNSKILAASYFESQIEAQLIRRYRKQINGPDIVPWACSLEGRYAYKAQRE